MKAMKCPYCGASLPDAGNNTRVICPYCEAVVDLREPGETGPVIAVDSKVAISKGTQFESEGKHHSLKAKAHVYAGTFRAEVKGQLDEARIEMPGGCGYAYARGDSSQQTSVPPTSSSSHYLDLDSTEDQSDELFTWIANHLEQLTLWTGLSVTLVTLMVALLPFICCIATIFFCLLVLPSWR